MAPIAFVHPQRVDAAKLGIGTELPCNRLQLGIIAHTNQAPRWLVEQWLAVKPRRFAERQLQPQGRCGIHIGADRHRR